MKNKVVLITGANGGLGTSITRSFLEAGALVTGVSDKISVAEFPQPRFVAISADLTKPSAATDIVQSVLARHGRLDMLIHVLGAFAGGKSIAETDDATWEQMQDLNLSSAFYVLRAAIPHLRKSGNGRIVAIGSLAAGEPHAGIGAYVTFKVGARVAGAHRGSGESRRRSDGEYHPAGHDGHARKSQSHARRRSEQMGRDAGRSRTCIVAGRRPRDAHDRNHIPDHSEVLAESEFDTVKTIAAF